MTFLAPDLSNSLKMRNETGACAKDGMSIAPGRKVKPEESVFKFT